MTESIASPDPLLVNAVLLILAIGLPVLFILAIRFLWDRNLQLGRSKELEKLIWQLHRIATALEHQLNLSFPAVQPGTEEPRDVTFLKPLVTHPNSAAPEASPLKPATTAAAAAQPEPSQFVAPPAAEKPAPPIPPLEEPSANEPPRRAGVNSMFGL